MLNIKQYERAKRAIVYAGLSAMVIGVMATILGIINFDWGVMGYIVLVAILLCGLPLMFSED